MSLSFPRNLFISVWFAWGRQEGERNGTVESCGFHLTVYRSPRAHRLFGRRWWSTASLLPSGFNLPSRGPCCFWKTQRGPPDPKRENPLRALTPGALPNPVFFAFCGAKCFSMAAQTRLFAAWKEQIDPWMPARSKYCSAPFQPSHCVLWQCQRCCAHLGCSHSTLWVICSWPFPFVFTRDSPRCLSEYFCSWSLAFEHFTLPNGLAADGPDFPLLALEAHLASFVFLGIS